MLCPITESFIFRILGFLSPVVAPGLVLCAGPYCLARTLGCCTHAGPLIIQKGHCLTLDNSTAILYLHNQNGTASLSLSRLACHNFNLADKHSITLAPAYMPTHPNVKADHLSQDWLVPKWNQLPHIAWATFHAGGLPEVDVQASSHTNQFQPYFTLEPWKAPYLWEPWACMLSTTPGHIR